MYIKFLLSCQLWWIKYIIEISIFPVPVIYRFIRDLFALSDFISWVRHTIMLIFLWQNIMDWYQWWEEPVHWSQHAHTRPKSVYIFILLTVLLSPLFVSFCGNMQLSKILIDDPPPPPFLLLQDLQDSHDILNYKFKRFEFEDDFFSMDDKYHLTF